MEKYDKIELKLEWKSVNSTLEDLRIIVEIHRENGKIGKPTP